MPGKRSQDVIQVNLRLSRDLHKHLVREANAAGRSLNQEMLLRLEQTFERVAADEILRQARANTAAATKLFEQTKELYEQMKPTSPMAAYLLGVNPSPLGLLAKSPTKRGKKK